MTRATEWTLDEAAHNRIYAGEVLPDSGFHETTPQEHPRAIVLAGQPGAGKGGLAEAARMEFAGNVVTLDLDQKREYHRDIEKLRETHPYTWASHTHQDARGWTDKLTHDFVEGRRNIVFDTTLGGADHWIGEIKKMQGLSTRPYEVEVRVLATHRLESEHGVHERFTNGLNKDGHSRFVPKEVRTSVYENLPANLDKLHEQTGARIRIYNREGAELYDSRTSLLKPGAALEQAREARLTDPERTRSLNNKWQTQQAWEQQLPESLQRNAKVTPPTAQNVLRENGELKIRPEVAQRVVDIFTIDRGVRVEPALARGALGLKVANAAAVAVDAYSTGREALHLLDQRNVTGVQSQMLRFGARNTGMFAGAVTGAQVGVALGVESGPGLLVTGAVGGLVGAIAGDKIMDAADQARINNQRGSDGSQWNLHPQQGWTRLPHPGEFGPQGPPANLAATAGMRYDSQTRTLHAGPRLSSELDYKASNTATELALAGAPALKDPFSHTPASIGETARPGIGATQPWTRDPHSHAWSRSVTEPATPATHGMPVQRTVAANPEQSRQLEAAAQATIAHNIAHSPQAIAQKYQTAYDQYGWKQHGPVPAAVLDAERTPPTRQRASDGHEYTQGQNGQWTTPGTLYGANTAQGTVRDELNATKQQVQAPVVAPAPATRPALTPQQIEAAAASRTAAQESRAPTPPAPLPPGRMSFAEAHKRRDEPEQISPGSLQPVGKLDVSGLDRKSMLNRMHQSQELDLMRQLEIAKAKDREEFGNEPAVQRTRERSQERAQERTHERTNERARDHAQERIPDPEAQSVRSARAAGAGSHQTHGLPMPQVAPAARLPEQPESSPHQPLAEGQAMRARLSQDHARQEHRGQMEQQREHQLQAQPEVQGWQPQHPQAEQAQAPRLREFSDLSHPQNALYNVFKEGFSAGTTEQWLTLSTAACYMAGIKKPDDLGDVEGRDGKLFFSSNSLFAQGVVLDATQFPPSVQQTMQQVQQFDQQRADNLARYQAQTVQANQQQGQGPVM